MKQADTEVLSWKAIIAMLVGVAVFTGVLLGVLSNLFGLSPRFTGGGVGASVGVVAAVLIAQRRAALARRNSR